MQIWRFVKDRLEVVPPDELERYLQTPGEAVWVDLKVSEVDVLQRLQERLNFHPLAIEDTQNRHQRPKVDEYEDHLFFIANPLRLVDDEYLFGELDIFLGRTYIVTVHQDLDDVVQEALRRINYRSSFRHPSTEYVLYVLFDTIVDAYGPILNEIDEQIEQLSEEVLRRPDQGLLEQVLLLQQALNEIWRVVEQERDLLHVLQHHKEDLLIYHDVLEYYLRDVHDHLIRISNTSILLRENLASLINVYLSSTSNRLNFVVNRLTIITIMIGVLTVVSGFYGMNFEQTFPPFSAEWGVPFTLGLMAFIMLVLLLIFRRMRLY